MARLRRNHFFEVRDGDFQRGIDNAVAHKWIAVHHRDRYRYILTDEGYAAGRQIGTAVAQLSLPADCGEEVSALRPSAARATGASCTGRNASEGARHAEDPGLFRG